MACFYPMAVMPKLFGEWTLYREWGRIGQGGQVRIDWFEDENQAAAALVTLEASKRQRGYWVGLQQLAVDLCFSYHK
jgi:predicted DNA-binding WGR domain protein